MLFGLKTSTSWQYVYSTSRLVAYWPKQGQDHLEVKKVIAHSRKRDAKDALHPVVVLHHSK